LPTVEQNKEVDGNNIKITNNITIPQQLDKKANSTKSVENNIPKCKTLNCPKIKKNEVVHKVEQHME